MTAPFRPARGLSSAHLQSIMASSGMRRLRMGKSMAALREASTTHILTTADGVRLAGLYTPRPASGGEPKALVILFHGWEGSAESTYLVETAFALWQAGYAVFRLNFRDHGDTHHLNPGIFHSCRLDEVVAACQEIQILSPVRPLLLAGYSLGGNFALRVALRAPEAAINLSQVVAVSPLINPVNGLRAIEQAPWFYEYYFMRKWRKSLRRKQALFPEHDIDDDLLNGDMYEVTDRLVSRYTEYDGAPPYLDGYSIAGRRLANLQINATLLTAEDDPVIPVEDFDHLSLPDCAQIIRYPHGGHCGFIHSWRLKSWAVEFLVQHFDRVTQSAANSANPDSLPMATSPAPPQSDTTSPSQEPSPYE
ncbi:MAG: YheT family hydrolase [Lysobacterales bacterium]